MLLALLILRGVDLTNFNATEADWLAGWKCSLKGTGASSGLQEKTAASHPCLNEPPSHPRMEWGETTLRKTLLATAGIIYAIASATTS